MLGQWRIVLRQAEEAARVGRYEEAYALATRSDVADHHHAVQFRSRLALDLIARATRRGAVDDLAGAIEDLALAEKMAAPPDSLAAARLNLADRLADEVRSSLDAAEPARTLERIEELARHKITGPAMRRMCEIAEAWQAGHAEGRRGEFGRAHEHLDRAERLATGAGAIAAQQAIAVAKVELETRQRGVSPKVEALYAALADGKWPQILGAAEAVLAVISEHPAARQARARAWQQIAAIGPVGAAQWPQRGARVAQAAAVIEPGPAASREEAVQPSAPETEGICWLSGQLGRTGDPGAAAQGVPPRLGQLGQDGRTLPRRAIASRTAAPPRPMVLVEAPTPKGRFLLWVDAVGGYLVCLDDRIVLGRAGPESHADIPLMGDLSRNHATLVRNGDGYLLHARQASFVNGKPVVDQVVLRDCDVIRLGSTVELEFRQPSPVSATARLSILSRHRLPLAVDGVLLMAETCIVGEASRSHIPAPALKSPVVLYRQAGSLWCRAQGAFEVDGRTCAFRAPLTLHSSVLGDGFSFSIEPLASQSV
jgi:hypothetical protein